MTVPSQMSLRRIPDALHLKVRIAYAGAWEALIDTHTDQALQFVCEFAPRLEVLDGLDLYFQVTTVPEPMQEPVRFRTLVALDLESLPPLTPLPVLTGWQRFRPDLVLEHQRYRHRYHEKTLELARMVGARAAEAIVATHVENAIGFTQLLRGAMPVNTATDRYLREFEPARQCRADGHAAGAGTGGGRGAHRPVRRPAAAASRPGKTGPTANRSRPRNRRSVSRSPRQTPPTAAPRAPAGWPADTRCGHANGGAFKAPRSALPLRPAGPQACACRTTTESPSCGGKSNGWSKPHGVLIEVDLDHLPRLPVHDHRIAREHAGPAPAHDPGLSGKGQVRSAHEQRKAEKALPR